LTRRMKLATFLGGRSTISMLCLISTLLIMRLKISTTKGKTSPDVGSSLGVSSLRGRLTERWICLSLLLYCLNVLRGNSNFPGRLSWSQMAIARRTKVDSIECLLAGWWCDSTFRFRLVRLGFLYTVCPKEPSSLLYVDVQEGKVAVWLSLHGEVDGEMYAIRVVRSFSVLRVHGTKPRICQPRNGNNTWAWRLPCCVPSPQSLPRRKWQWDVTAVTHGNCS
jgi:hypothetical protein